MRCLVTGGAGFIGSALVRALLQRGDEVRVLDDLSTGHRSNLAGVGGPVELVEGDVRAPERLAAAAAGCEIAFHLAALPSVPRSVSDPVTSHDVNATGSLQVLLAARDAGVRRVVFASSSSVYGSAGDGLRREDQPTAPMSPYAVSKLTGEGYCRAFAEVYGLESVVLRYFNIFGPRQDPGSAYAAVVPRFLAAALAGERPTIHGDGLQVRDFTFVEDAVRANLLAADVPGVSGEVFNVAAGRGRTLLDLVACISRVTGAPVDAAHGPVRPGDVLRSRADTAKARDRLGWAPQVDFEDGVRRTWEHLRDAPPSVLAAQPAAGRA